MILYKKKTLSVIKYLIALIIFILAMTITFDDVYGINIPNRIDQHENSSDNHRDYTVDYSSENNPPVSSDNNPNPVATPEPGTLILLASGLGIISLYKKFTR